MNREIISRAVMDALTLRQEIRKHDIDATTAAEMLVASLPAFIAWEAAQPPGEQPRAG